MSSSFILRWCSLHDTRPRSRAGPCLDTPGGVSLEWVGVYDRLADSVLSPPRNAAERALRPVDRPARPLDRRSLHRILLRRVVRRFSPRLARRDVQGGPLPVDRGRGVHDGRDRAGGSALRGDASRRDGGRIPDSPLLRRLHARRSRLRAVLYLPEPLRLLDGDAGPGGQLPGPLRLLGGRGALLLSPDRLLVRA